AARPLLAPALAQALPVVIDLRLRPAAHHERHAFAEGEVRAAVERLEALAAHLEGDAGTVRVEHPPVGEHLGVELGGLAGPLGAHEERCDLLAHASLLSPPSRRVPGGAPGSAAALPPQVGEQLVEARVARLPVLPV